MNLRTLASEIQVTGYLDYRSYLNDLYALGKSRLTPFSWLLLAEHLGFSQTNVIRLVAQGKRMLARSSAETIASSLELRHHQRRYFLALVEYNNAKTQKMKDQHFADLMDEKARDVDELTQLQMLYFSHWYYPVVKECLRKDRNADAIGLAKSLYPHLSREQVEDAIQVVQKLIAVSPSHSLNPADTVAGALTLMEYHKQMLEVAKGAVDAVPEDRRDFNALTIRLSEQAFRNLSGEIQRLCEEAMEADAKAIGDEPVVQFNVQLFYMTRPVCMAQSS